MSIARLQQVTTISLILFWAACAGLALWTGGGLWLAAVALLPLLAYAGCLALEFTLMRSLHGVDQAPRASPGELFRAWWHECLCAPRVFGWQQPFRHQRWPDQLPHPASGVSRRGVVLIHGFFCNRGVWNAWLERLTRQGTPFVAVNLHPPFATIDDYASLIGEAVRKLHAATGQAPVAVAHSMGGLALRHWWSQQTDAPLIHHAITLGTPHHGTWLAKFAFSPNGRQMRVDSTWIAELRRREGDQLDSRRMSCFYSTCDNIVFPPSSAILEGATNYALPGVAHVHMVSSPEPWSELQRRLVEPDAASDHPAPAPTVPAVTS